MSARIARPVAGYVDSEDRIWAVVAHVGGAFTGFVAGLLVLLMKGGESPVVRDHAVEALNFQITWCTGLTIAAIVAICSLGTLWFLIFLPWLVLLGFSALAAYRASLGQFFRYPLSLRVVQ